LFLGDLGFFLGFLKKSGFSGFFRFARKIHILQCFLVESKWFLVKSEERVVFSVFGRLKKRSSEILAKKSHFFPKKFDFFQEKFDFSAKCVKI